MKSNKIAALLVFLTVAVMPAVPAMAVSKEIVQIQTQIQDLANLVQKLQQSNDERMGVIKSLIEQNTDTVNKLTASLTTLQKSLQSQNSDTQAKVDQVSTQIQALNDSVDELKARTNKLQKQLEDMQAQQQGLPSSSSMGGAVSAPGSGSAAAGQAPPADVLYNNAQRDYSAGRYDLAVQQFADYLRYYPNNDQAGNAQFAIADVEYRQGNFEAAARDFDKVLEHYPGGNKAATAQLKKGFSLIELGRKDAGAKELQSLIARFPHALEAQEARDRLRKLGFAATPAHKR
jgi:tol-pal system protein YbgF